MARKERKPRRPSFEEQARRIAELESALHPFRALWACQHNPRAVRAHHAFTLYSVGGPEVLDVHVTLWLGPRRAGMVVAEAYLVQRPDQDGDQPDPVWIEPIFAYDLAKQWEGSGNPYYQHAAVKLRAIEASMYEKPKVENASDASTSEG